MEQPADHPGFSLKDSAAKQGQGSDRRQDQKVLSVIALKDLDLEKELAEQYTHAKQVFSDAQYDTETPLNQKAQALNTVQSILQAIIKMQQELYNIERLKMLEDSLIGALQAFPELKEAFMTAYEEALTKAKI